MIKMFKQVFQHVRRSDIEFTSHVLVEDLIRNQPELFLIGMVIEEMYDTHDTDQERIQFYKNMMNIGPHCGDCVKMPSTCIRCLIEDIYFKGLEMMKEANNFELVDILAILLATEEIIPPLFQQYCDAKTDPIPAALSEKQQLNDQIDHLSLFKTRYQLWESLSLDKKEQSLQRAKTMMDLFRINQ